MDIVVYRLPVVSYDWLACGTWLRNAHTVTSNIVDKKNNIADSAHFREIAMDGAASSGGQYSALTHWRQCACVHFLAAISDNKQQLLDTVAKHSFV